MFTTKQRLCDDGTVTRLDGATVEGVAYEISAHRQWLRNRQTTEVRLQVSRLEAIYWFLESGDGLCLNLADGRRLRFDLAGIPDHSGWVGFSAGAFER